MTITLATKDDYPDIYKMALGFHDESPYREIPTKPDKVNELILSFLVGSPDRICILLKEDGKSVGIIAGIVTEPTFCELKIAHELIWYVLPAYRGGLGGMRLRKAFEYWASNIVKADATQMASVENEYATKLRKHYQQKGYTLFEQVYLKFNGSTN